MAKIQLTSLFSLAVAIDYVSYLETVDSKYLYFKSEVAIFSDNLIKGRIV